MTDRQTDREETERDRQTKEIERDGQIKRDRKRQTDKFLVTVSLF